MRERSYHIIRSILVSTLVCRTSTIISLLNALPTPVFTPPPTPNRPLWIVQYFYFQTRNAFGTFQRKQEAYLKFWRSFKKNTVDHLNSNLIYFWFCFALLLQSFKRRYTLLFYTATYPITPICFTQQTTLLLHLHVTLQVPSRTHQ